MLPDIEAGVSDYICVTVTFVATVQFSVDCSKTYARGQIGVSEYERGIQVELLYIEPLGLVGDDSEDSHVCRTEADSSCTK